MKKLSILAIAAMLAISGFAQTKHINILSVNDMHGTIENFPKFAALVDSLKKEDPELLILSAGDNRTGNPYNDMYAIPSYPMTALMNAVGFNASAIGNHEWDNKVDGLRTQMALSSFPYLCANVQLPDSVNLPIIPYKFFTVNGVRVGILGMIQTGMHGIPDCHPNNVKGITFPHHDEVIPEYKWMRDQCEVLLLLAHDGYEEDIETANKFDWFDAIIGGHSHTKVQGNDIHNGVLITQAKNKLAFATLTKMDIENGKVTKKSSELIDVKAMTWVDEDVAKLVDLFSKNEKLKEKVVDVDRDFQGWEELGNMMCDAILNETGSEISLQNGGGVRFETFPAGPMLLEDILKLDPFGNEAVVYELTGKEVADMIQNCFYIDEKQTPYVGGITYEMTIDKDKKPTGIKIKMLDGSKFDLKKKYKFVTNSYVSSIITSKHADEGTSTYRPCSDLMLDYLPKQGHVDYQGTHRATIIEK